jgi:Fibronectin type III domain
MTSTGSRRLSKVALSRLGVGSTSARTRSGSRFDGRRPAAIAEVVGAEDTVPRSPRSTVSQHRPAHFASISGSAAALCGPSFRAFNSGGDSSYSAIASAVTDAPSNLTARSLSRSQIALAWTDNKQDESGFRIERSTDLATFTEVATVGANSTSASIGHLRRGTTYYFRVRAFTAATTTAYSNIAFAVTASR